MGGPARTPFTRSPTDTASVGPITTRAISTATRRSRMRPHPAHLAPAGEGRGPRRQDGPGLVRGGHSGLQRRRVHRDRLLRPARRHRAGAVLPGEGLDVEVGDWKTVVGRLRVIDHPERVVNGVRVGAWTEIRVEGELIEWPLKEP